jgi:hypothetical protein
VCSRLCVCVCVSVRVFMCMSSCSCVCVLVITWTLIDVLYFLTGEGVPLQVGQVLPVRRGNEDVACAFPVAR